MPATSTTRLRPLRRLLVGATLAATALAGRPTFAAAASAAPAPACTNADLVTSYRYSDSGAGHAYGWVVLRNRSDHRCRTGGYGGLSYVGGRDGHQIGAPAVRTDRAEVRSLVLQPGQRLRSAIDEVQALDYPKRRCRPAHVDGFRVYVPDAHASQFVVHPTTGCRNPAITLITQRPYARP